MSKIWIFDTETTSREADREIVEAAWLDIETEQDLVGESDRIVLPFDDIKAIVDFRAGRLRGYCERFRPDNPISFGSMAVHHILPVELEDCPPASSFSIPDCVDYIVGHNIDFDWEAAGSPAHVKRICTDAMARWTWPEADSYSQSALLYMLLGATADTRALLRDAHSAAVDVGNNAWLLDKILDEHPDITTWSALWEYSEKCRIPRCCPFAQHRGVPLAELARTDPSYCDWMLRQHWLDPYLRTGVENAVRDAYRG